MSIERCPRALAFFFTSVLLAGSALADVPAHHAKAAELEAGLASKKDVYLVVGVESRELAIRVRGVTLERVPLASVDAYEQRRLSDSAGATRLEIPRVFVTAATISLVDRRVVAPDSLKPWSEEAETGRPVTKDDARPVPPPSFDVPLDEGWTLEVRQDAVRLSGTGRFVDAIADGWLHVTGRGVRDPRPTVRVVMEEEPATRIHHLFKKGTAILVVPDLTYREPVIR